MNVNNISERLHRTAKIFMDTGEAVSEEDAIRRLESYKLSIVVGPDIAASAMLQATLLTTINTARRCFLGGVYIRGRLDVELLVPWKRFKVLGEAVSDLRGQVAKDVQDGVPEIFIGDTPGNPHRSPFAVQATFDGWSGGVIPCEQGKRLAERQGFIPAGILSGALAVSEAFQHACGSVVAGRRDVGLSLWHPEPDFPWMESANKGPDLEQLPSRLWVIGLGHLGQSLLWTLGFLPYANPGDVHLVLQDHDSLSAANESTSPLTFQSMIGFRKTRAMAHWCEQRGFTTSIIERRLDNHYRIADEDPRMAFCGVDNSFTRSILEDIGFRYIVEAGLGKGTDEYLSFQVHTFPGPRKARDIWKENVSVSISDAVAFQPAYSRLATGGLDKCGIVRLAGRSVGASFVGVAVSTMVVSEMLRMIHGGKSYLLIDGTMKSIGSRQAIERCNTELFNPGVTKVKEP